MIYDGLTSGPYTNYPNKYNSQQIETVYPRPSQGYMQPFDTVPVTLARPRKFVQVADVNPQSNYSVSGPSIVPTSTPVFASDRNNSQAVPTQSAPVDSDTTFFDAESSPNPPTTTPTTTSDSAMSVDSPSYSRPVLSINTNLGFLDSASQYLFGERISQANNEIRQAIQSASSGGSSVGFSNATLPGSFATPRTSPPDYSSSSAPPYSPGQPPSAGSALPSPSVWTRQFQPGGAFSDERPGLTIRPSSSPGTTIFDIVQAAENRRPPMQQVDRTELRNVVPGLMPQRPPVSPTLSRTLPVYNGVGRQTGRQGGSYGLRQRAPVDYSGMDSNSSGSEYRRSSSGSSRRSA